MKKGMGFLVTLAMLVGLWLTASVPAGAAGPDWSDNFNGAAQQTWVTGDHGASSTFVFTNDEYRLHTEKPGTGEGLAASYVEGDGTDVILQGTVRRIDAGDKFLAYLLARSDVSALNAYSLGISSGDGASNEPHLWLGKFSSGAFSNIGGAGGSVLPWGSGNYAWYDCKIKFAVIGQNLYGKVWKEGDPEPAQWQVQATDSGFATGDGGVAVATYSALGWNVVQAAFDDVSQSTTLERWVDASYNSSTLGWGVTHFATIQSAVNAASAGDTIHVAAGTYAENITITQAVTLIGDPGDASAGPGSNAPVIDGGSTPGSAFFIENGVSNVTIQGFEMRNFTSNANGIGNGISAWEASTSNVTIQDNYFHDLGWNAVLVGNDGALGDHTNWTIKGNVAADVDYIAFELTNTSNSSIEGNVIHLSSPEVGAIFSSARRSETGLTIKDNEIDGTPSASYPVVYIYAHDLEVANPNLDSVLIEGNKISTIGTPAHVYIYNIGTGTVTNVVVRYNSLTSLRNVTTSTIDASGNWWASADPTVVRTAANDGSLVDYTPWLASGTDTSSNPGFQGDFSALWVDDDSLQAGTKGRIQEGIDLVSGSTVNVAAGTYVEGPQFVIDKDLSIAGADKTTTILKPAADTGSSGDLRGWFLVQDGKTFNLSKVTLDGTGKKVFQAIRSRGSGTINDCVFTNIKYEENGPSYAGFAIAAFGTPAMNVDVTNCTFTEIGRVGVLFYGTGITDSTFSGNTYTGKGSGNWLDYGVEAGAGAKVTISNNTISDCLGVASSDGSTSAGILVTTYYGAGTEATITDNTITGNTTGVAVGYDASDTSAVVMHNNNISGNTEYGVESTAPTVDAELNYWGAETGPYHATTNQYGDGNAVSDYVDYSPWLGLTPGSDPMTYGVVPGDSIGNAITLMDPGDTLILMAGNHPGGIVINKGNIKIKGEPGTIIGSGSPAFTVTAPNVTLEDLVIDGNGSTDPGILVQTGGDNLTVQNCEIREWADGLEIANSVTSFKFVGNWVHDNTDAGLQVDSTVTLSGVVTIEGNLFKENGGNGIENLSGNSLVAEYNSWGALAGPASGDGISADVDADPWTFVEAFMDMNPDTEAVQRDVNESESFNVALKVDAENLLGLTFEFTWDTEKLTLINSDPTWSTAFYNKCAVVGTPPAGTFAYRCTLDTEYDADGGTVATFNFTAALPGIASGEDGPWTAYFDVAHDVADTSAGALGGAKVYVNNAGYGAPSASERDITDTDDGQIDITGIANYTGFVDLQGRANDSGASIKVYDLAAKASATLLASATSLASGAYTTAYETGQLLAVGATYYLYVDAYLYLPTTATVDANYADSKSLSDRPLTTLLNVKLLGGDATNDNSIEVTDLTCIGGDYGLAPGVCGADGTSDVNNDSLVDILDLVLAAGNYDLTSSPWTP